MKTYNQFLETPFSEEANSIKPPEPPSEEEDPSIKSKEKRQMQIKKMVLLKKMQAVRAGAGADIVASHEPEGEMVEGSLHKWFSGSKSKDGKPGWVQSDGSPCANEPGETKTPKCYSSAKRASMSKKELRSADARKSKQDPNQQQKSGAAKPTYVATDKKKKVSEDYYRGTGEKVVARTKKYMEKKGEKGAPGLDAMKARQKDHEARRGVKKEENEVDECWKTHKKVGMKMKNGKLVNDCRPKNEEVEVTEGSEKSYYLDKEAEKRAQQKAAWKAQNKAAAKERAAAKRRKERNDLRRQGKYGAVGGYYVTKHMERESVELVDYLKKEAFNFSTNLYKKQQQEIYASKEEVSEESDQKSSESSILTFNEVTRLKKETGYVKGGTKKPTAPKQKDAALDFVKKSITAKYGKGAIMSGGSRQSKKVKGEKSTMGTGKYKKAADAKKQTAADAKKRGFKSTQDYANTMARYGGKDNYDRGRGLGT